MPFRRRIILIGGAPTVGKSIVARLLSEHLGVPWISTDHIRDVMRLASTRKTEPGLFVPEGYTAERFLTEFSAEQIAEIEWKQGEVTWEGVRQFIVNNHGWKNGFIVEGVGMLPHLVARDFGDDAEDAEIRTVFLVDDAPERVRDVVFTRGLWDDAHRYPDELKQKEVDWVLKFSHKIRDQAGKYGYPLVEVRKRKEDLAAVLAVLQEHRLFVRESYPQAHPTYHNILWYALINGHYI